MRFRFRGVSIPPSSPALLVSCLLCAAAVDASAQRVEPSAFARQTQADTPPRSNGTFPGSTPTGAIRADTAFRVTTHPRTQPVATAAFVSGVAGGYGGYLLAEQSCTRRQAECWDHILYIPAGYLAGVMAGGGLAGVSEGCRSGMLRSAGGGLLGFLAGAAFGAIVEPLGLISLPAGPVMGATWLVTKCRIGGRASAQDSSPARR